MAKPWLERRSDWLNGYAEEKPIKKTKKLSEGVVFVLPKCPDCGNKKLRCYGSEDGIRYYKCKCGAKFKAIEQEN